MASLNKILLLAISLAFLVSCDSNEKVNAEMIVFPDQTDAERPDIEFDETSFDFGTVLEGDGIRQTFSFTNVGDAPLIIAQVNPDCGCTSAKDWPKDAIAPGKKGQITITFDTSNRPGYQEKKINIVANTLPTTTVITLSGQVIGPDTQP